MTNKLKERTDQASIGELSKSAIGELYDLIQVVEEELAGNKRRKEWLEAAVNLKYEIAFAAKRLRMGRDTGSISIEDTGYLITCNTAKKVEWQQDILANIAGQVNKHVTAIESIDEIKRVIEVYYKIPERAYSELSYEIQKMIEPARILTTGKASYKITKLDE